LSAPLTGDEWRHPVPETEGRPMDLVTILIIVILVLLAIYLFQRVF
jgi:hypothetical protein